MIKRQQKTAILEIISKHWELVDSRLEDLVSSGSLIRPCWIRILGVFRASTPNPDYSLTIDMYAGSYPMLRDTYPMLTTINYLPCKPRGMLLFTSDRNSPAPGSLSEPFLTDMRQMIQRYCRLGEVEVFDVWMEEPSMHEIAVRYSGREP